MTPTRSAIQNELAATIAEHLRLNPGVVDLQTVRELSHRNGFSLMQLNEAMRELQQLKLAEYCNSCHGFISPTTTHAGGCPHGD